jgi:lipopolysaccharide biosynthesis glycosyltransferase
VIALQLPALADADVAELADLDLGSHLLAAPTQIGRNVSGFGVIHDAAKRLGRRTDAAVGLRRTAHARHAFDFDAFTEDVLVLDLARMRAEGFSGQALALVEEFGLTALEAMHYLVGPDRATVPVRWASVPARTPVRDPALIHWVGGVKPWQPVLAPERDRWRRIAAALPDG